MLYLPSVKWEADLWGKEFWRCVFGAHPPYFLRSLPFLQSFLQAGGVSITLASSKFWVSPLKAFVKSKNAIRFHHQAFIICKNRHIQISLKILIEVIRQKIVSNVILAFLDYLKPRIFFAGQPWLPTETSFFFKISGSAPGMPISSLLKLFALLFIYWSNPQHFFYCSVKNEYVTLIVIDHCFAFNKCCESVAALKAHSQVWDKFWQPKAL